MQRSNHPPIAAIFGSGILAISLIGLLCAALGVNYADWAQVLTAVIAIAAAYKWL